MRLHPRYFITSKASREISSAIADLEQKHELTLAELVAILGEIVWRYSLYAVKYERAPETEHEPEPT